MSKSPKTSRASTNPGSIRTASSNCCCASSTLPGPAQRHGEVVPCPGIVRLEPAAPSRSECAPSRTAPSPPAVCRCCCAHRHSPAGCGSLPEMPPAPSPDLRSPATRCPGCCEAQADRDPAGWPSPAPRSPSAVFPCAEKVRPSSCHPTASRGVQARSPLQHRCRLGQLPRVP